MKPAFAKGARVWFFSKYGDRVTGRYDGLSMHPGGPVHIVISDDAFGPGSPKGVHCAIKHAHGIHLEQEQDQ